mgnify:CR=1 FL=1
MRYIRQEKFIGKEKHDLLRKKTVSIVGLGALGSVASELLTRAGIKKLILIDRDFLELSNLQRQSLFEEKDIGKSKAVVLKEKLNEINKDVDIISYFDNLDNENIDLINSDLILDCTDNLETRFLINEYSVKNKIPFIYGSAVGDSGACRARSRDPAAKFLFDRRLSRCPPRFGRRAHACFSAH